MTWDLPKSADYTFLNKQINTFQFYQADALRTFFAKLDNAASEKISVLHIGDSHVQADIFTGRLRSLLQNNLGAGGRGLVFPYSTANTHSAIDYFSYHTGIWTSARNIEMNPRLPMGVSGVSSRTYSSNSSFRLNFKQPFPETYTHLKIFCRTGEQSFDVFVTNGAAHSDTLWLQPSQADHKNFVEGRLPAAWQYLQFGLKDRDSAQSQFELYGISIESRSSGGLIYHASGINGATHMSILRQSLMDEQLTELRPDLVYFDLGGNDFYFGNMNEGNFRGNLERIIQRIRNALPNVPIILASTQDMCRAGYSLGDCDKFSRIVKELAKQYNCAFYDYYWVAGGPKAMRKWYHTGLSKSDLVHLSADGYYLKGALIAEAFQNTYNWFKSTDTGALIHDIDSLINPPIDTTRLAQQELPAPPVNNWIWHKVRSGESLYSIAVKYGVTIYQIKAWNGLRNNFIYKGLALKIYRSGRPVAAQPSTVNQPVSTAKSSPSSVKAPAKAYPATPSYKVVYHKVRKGETLYGIALKYHTTVDKIKRLNGLRSSNLSIGKVLRIK